MSGKKQDKKLYNLLLILNTTNLIFSLGARLLDLFPNVEELFSKRADLSKLGLSMSEIIKLKNPNHNAVAKDLHWVKQDNHYIITIYDADYPELLKEIQNPPLILFVIGNLQLLKSSQIAIVGSRNPTYAGVETAYNFARILTRSGLVITSGFAVGIDAAGHNGALDAFGKTIAVMGTGLNNVYPLHHAKLAQKIVANGGALVSEFPLDAKAKAWHFPLRNRIISGLSMGTLIVEATTRSGSLITARYAGEQGREVFAIPGSIYNPAARGCHNLISQGAKLVEQPIDILEEFPEFISTTPKQVVVVEDIKKKSKLDYKYQKLLDCVGYETTTINIIALRSKLPVSQVSIMLLELELQGVIKTVMGGYIKV